VAEEGRIALAVGVALGASTYTLTSATGAAGMDQAQSKTEFNAYRMLLLPVAGPFVASRAFKRPLGRGAAIMSGLAQTVALGTTLTGALVVGRYQDRPPKPRKVGEALFGVGVIWLGASIIGATVVAGTRLNERPGDPFFRRLLIPVVGGYAAMPATDKYIQKWGGAFLGTLQTAALASTVAGLTIMRRHPRRFTAMALPTMVGARLSLAGRF